MQSLLGKSEEIVSHRSIISVSKVHPNIGLLIVEVGLSLTLCLLILPAFFYWVALSSLEIRVYILSCCILLCRVLLLPLINLIFSEGKQRRNSGPGWRRGVGGKGGGKEKERERRHWLGYSDEWRICK